MSRPRIAPLKTLAALTIAIALVAFGAPAVTAASQPVRTGTTSVGKVLVNAKGKTLYVFAADSPRKSTCTGACAKAWPPAPASAATLGHSADVKAKLGFITRADGKTQLTVNGLPAYTYAGDSASGQANGQGVNASGGLWWVIAPSGIAIKTASSSKNPVPSAPGGGASSPPGQYDYLY